MKLWQLRMFGMAPELVREFPERERETSMMKVHELKSWPEYFGSIEVWRKTCEVRINDRAFKIGDVLALREWIPEFQHYTGRKALVRITHILDDKAPGVMPGYVVLSVVPFFGNIVK